MTERYLEDFTVGQTFGSGRLRIDEEQIRRFASAFDPQPFHLDDEAARDTMFRGLAASGWHTAALSMRMLTQSSLAAIANGLVGIEVRTMHWPRATRPGDTLRLTVEVLETKPSRSRPGWGTALLRWTTRNQNDEIVMKLENVAWIACRPAIER
jgi:acyl dehydratase